MSDKLKIMQENIADITENLNWMDEPIKADKWRNLLFSKDGKSWLGRKIWESEEAALQGIKNAINYVGKPIGVDGKVVNAIRCEGPDTSPEGVKCLLFEKYSHTIQIPLRT